MEVHNMGSRQQQAEYAAELMRLVGLQPTFLGRYPHSFSGGQRQRIGIARALALRPELLVCDEPVSALDVSVQAAVTDLLMEIQREQKTTLLFISHDLSTIASFADQIVVLYAGRVAEQGDTDKVLSPPYHPYTRLLISSVPEMRVGWLDEISKDEDAMKAVGGGVDLNAAGCPFYARCPLAIDGTCDTTPPPEREDGAGHVIACHREISELGG